MKKNKLLIAIGAVVLVVLTFSVLLLDKSNNNTVMIGVTGPQVGLYADIGQSMMNGAFLACEDFNSRGELKSSIDAQNDSGEPKNAMTCINKMLARGYVERPVGGALWRNCRNLFKTPSRRH